LSERRYQGEYPYFLGPFLFLRGDRVFWVGYIVAGQVKGGVQVRSRSEAIRPYFLGPFLFLRGDQVFWVGMVIAGHRSGQRGCPSRK